MAERIPQSTTIRVPLQAYLASDHISAATGKTIAITISKNGAAYGNPSAGATNATEIANGSYYVDLSTTDTGTLGPLFVRGSVATVDDVIAIYHVVKATNGGYTALPDAAADAAGGLIISDAGGLDADAQRSDVAAILVDTGTTLDARIPAALVGGRMDVSVGAMAANVMTAAAAAADFTTEVTSGLAQEATLSTVAGYLDTEIAAIKAKTDNLPASPAAVGSAMTLTAAYDAAKTAAQAGDAMALTSAAVDAVHDEVIEGAVTLRQMMRGFAAALMGKASGLETTTAVYRDIGDTKDRLTATVDELGNRTVVTRDLT